MKNLLALVGTVVVIVAGAGWYLGWYKFSTESGHMKVDLDLKKAAEDVKKGGNAVENLIEKGTEKKVDGLPTSLPFEGKGSLQLPSLPSLPSVPAPAPLEFNPDGSLKTTIKIDLPPPPTFQGNK